MIKRVCSCFFIFLVLVQLQGCTNTSHPLRIGAQKWIGYEFLFLAQKEGWLDTTQIQLVETDSATDSIEALKSGQIGAAALTLDEVLRARDQGIPLRIVLVIDESAGADVVLTRHKLQSMSELKGLRIGVESNATGALMLQAVLDQAGLRQDEVTIVDSPIDRHLSDWNAGKYNAVICYEPVATQIQNQGAYRLIDSRSIFNLIFDVIAVRDDIVENYQNALYELTRAYFRVLKHYNLSPQDVAYRMGVHLGIDGLEVLSALRGLQMPNERTNMAYLSHGGELEQIAVKIESILLKHHMLKSQKSMDHLVTRKFIKPEN